MTPLELAMFPIRDWKDGQWDLVTRIVCSPKKYVVLEAPTGTGKSVVALGVARMMGGQTRILTGHKNLQDQYARMLSLPTVRGRGNFPCPEEAGTHADAAVCSVGGPCVLKRVPQQKTVMVDGRPKTVTLMTGKPGCPYYDQKLEGQEADVSVLNYAYWLAQVNYAGSFGRPDLLICDEAHILEEEIRRFATLDFRRSHMKLLGISYPKARDDPDKWKRWARKFVTSHASAYDEHKRKRSGFMNRTARRSHRAFMTLYENARTLIEAVLPDDGWTIRETPFGAEARPVWITPLTEKLFLKHTQKVLFMSATILSGELFAHQLGIDPKDIEFIQAPCPFPKKNRPIYYQPVGEVNRNFDLTKLVRAVDTLMENHPGERGLVHTVSYKIARVILAQSKYPERLFSHETSGEKDGALDRFRATPGAVMVSPSVTTGVDLPYDLCQWQAICKLSFPDLGDPQIKKRMALGPDGEPDPLAKRWYTWHAACSLVQAYGRGVRAEDDACVTYLLDGSWRWFRQAARDLMPAWFTEAIVKPASQQSVYVDELFREKPMAAVG